VGGVVQLESSQPETLPPTIETPKQNARLWGGWPTVGLGVAILAIYFIAQAAVAIAFFFSSGATKSQSVLNLSTNGNLISIATIVSAIFGMGFIILFIKIRKGAGFRDYLELKSIPKKTVLILLAVIIGLTLLSWILNQVSHSPQDTTFDVNAYEATTWPALLWVAVVIFAPLFEENFFRGFIFVGLKQTSIGAVGTIALTSLAWALLHMEYDIYGMATILVLGITFGIVRLKTGSLWSTLFLHSAWNIIAMVSIVMNVNGLVH
jgi:hypothetical protein